MAISSFFHFENVRAAFRERYLDIRQTIRTATFLPIERRGRNVRLRAFIYVFFFIFILLLLEQRNLWHGLAVDRRRRRAFPYKANGSRRPWSRPIASFLFS